jgi:hypothetical protein
MHVYLAGAELVSEAGLVTVSTMVLRCAASGAVGKYSEPRCPQAANKHIAVQAMATDFHNRFAILLLCIE